MPDIISVGVRGSEAFIRKLRGLGPAALSTAGGSLYRSAEAIMTKSKDEYVPVDTGNLRRTGHVDRPKIEGFKISVQMGYGGTAATYAITVHESNRAYRSGKQWKYLETPTKMASNDIVNALRTDLNAALAGKGSIF